jgi:hypothetical protein
LPQSFVFESAAFYLKDIGTVFKNSHAVRPGGFCLMLTKLAVASCLKISEIENRMDE